MNRLVGALIALAIPISVARAQTFVAAGGDAGRWGTPFGWLGPRGAPVWEEYRKGWEDHVPPYPNVVILDAGALDGNVLYDDVRQGYNTSSQNSFKAPGTFIGPVAALRSPPGAAIQLVGTSGRGFDVRFAFAENSAADGGAPLNQFVINGGGDNGRYMDPYSGNWGVDGLYLQLHVDNSGATWVLTPRCASLVAGPSPAQEGCPDDAGTRTTHQSEVAIQAAPLDGGLYDLAVPSTQPLQVRWQIQTTDAGVSLLARLGPNASLSWLFDDGVTRFGLTQPGNSDGVPYQGGRLDLPSLVPVFFACVVTQGVPDPLPPLQMTFSLAQATPVIEGLAPSTDAGAPVTFTVTARDGVGAVVTNYAQAIQFTSTDSAATLPSPFTFSVVNSGTSTFQATFRTPGLQSLTVIDAETPVIASTQSTSVTAMPAGSDGGTDGGTGAGSGPGAYRIGCGGCSGAPDGALTLALLALGARLALSRRLAPLPPK